MKQFVQKSFPSKSERSKKVGNCLKMHSGFFSSSPEKWSWEHFGKEHYFGWGTYQRGTFFGKLGTLITNSSLWCNNLWLWLSEKSLWTILHSSWPSDSATSPPTAIHYVVKFCEKTLRRTSKITPNFLDFQKKNEFSKHTLFPVGRNFRHRFLKKRFKIDEFWGPRQQNLFWQTFDKKSPTHQNWSGPSQSTFYC